ncbi:MAG: DEAD/DEAH box helicase family protein, partial [Flavobacteriales bacterium]|nr:DEAD/DEAH box helicase family protein [Flavobacteriales bacterium]
MEEAFNLVSDFQPTGDQPEAIRQLTEGIMRGDRHQVLLGVTGSGKTFTMANVIANLNRPALILSHNKTLAAQLFGEMRQFFPNNAVEYYVSYYDYYQPEAYLPTTDTYIEKDLAINDEIEKHRLSTASTLLSGRRDVVVVASVSCIYGIGNPTDFKKNVITVKVGEQISREKLLNLLVTSLYSRNSAAAGLERGQFRVKGDTVDVYLANADYAYRIFFFGNEIEELERIDPQSGSTLASLREVVIYPANNFVTSRDTL